MHSSKRGYVAILSALIVSVVLTSIVFAESASAFWSRDDQIDAQNQILSHALANSCAYEALLQFQQYPVPISTPETISVFSNQSCVIDSISNQNTAVSITLHANSESGYAEVMVNATRDPLGNVLLVTYWYSGT